MRQERLARSGVIGLAGSAFAAFGALLLTVIVARGFGPYGTGLFFQAVGLFTIAAQILNLGTNSGIVRFSSEQKALHGEAQPARILGIALLPVLIASILVTGAVLMSSGPLSELLASPGQAAELESLLRALAPFLAVASVLEVLLTGLRMTRGLGVFALLQDLCLPISRLLLVFLTLAVGVSVMGSLQAWAAPLAFWLIVAAGLLAWPIRRDLRARKAAEPAPPLISRRRFWGFAWARAVGSALEVSLSWSDVLIVAALLSPVEAGIYAVATRCVRAGQMVDRALRLSASPVIAGLLAKADLAGATRLHTNAARAMVVCTWPFYLVLATLGPAVLSLFGPGFAGGGTVLSILSVAMMVAAAAGMLQSVMLMGGRSSWQMVSKALALTMSISLSLWLVPIWGLVGAAVSGAAVIAIDTSIAAYLVHRRMGIRLQPARLIPAGALPLAIFGLGGLGTRLLFGTSLLVLFLFLLVSCSLYLVALWRFRDRLGISAVWQLLPGRVRQLIRV